MTDKTYLGYRYWASTQEVRGYKTHTVEVMQVSINDYGHGPYISHESMFEITWTTMPTPERNNDGTVKEWQVNGFGFRLGNINLSSWIQTAAYKTAKHFLHVASRRGVCAILKKIKAVRVEYQPDKCAFYPRKFKAVSRLYFDSLENGLELKRVA